MSCSNLQTLLSKRAQTSIVPLSTPGPRSAKLARPCTQRVAVRGLRAQQEGVGDSGLWLPPTRPKRDSVKAQASNNGSNMAKIKVDDEVAFTMITVSKGVKQLSYTVQVVGVGGGGSNAVNRMLSSQLTGVELMVMNTDAQVRPMNAVSSSR